MLVNFIDIYFYHPYAGDILLWGITIFYWKLYIKTGNEIKLL